jgi:predicted transcriptional regulator
VQIIVPAYNVKADQATRFEAQIAAIMHMHREQEIRKFKEDVPPPKVGRPRPTTAGGKLPDNNNRKTAITQGRENNSTDEIILKILKGREMGGHEVARMINLSTDTVRTALSRLLTRGQVSRRSSGLRVLWTTVGEQNDAGL